eukprot:g79035.t1
MGNTESQQRVQDIMTLRKNCVQTKPTVDLQTLATLLSQHKISAVVIVDEKTQLQAIGLVTASDIVRAMAQGISPGTHAEVLIKGQQLVTAHFQQSTEELKAIFLKEKKHHVVVVDTSGQFAGIVTSYDMARLRQASCNWPESSTLHFRPFRPIL